MTNHAPGTTHPGSAPAFGDALRRAVARDAGTVELEQIVRARARAFAASELRRGLSGAGNLTAAAGRLIAAAMRNLRHALPAALLCLCVGSIPAMAEDQAAAIMLLAIGDGADGVMSVPMHVDTLGGPAVVVVHDALGRDSRADRYIDQLLTLGFTVLEIEPFPERAEGAATSLHLDDLQASARVIAAARALASVAGVNPRAISALGFGAGARAVLLAPAGADGGAPFFARALLYPGCRTLHREAAAANAATPPPGLALQARLLLLHGGRDPANTEAACATLAAELGAVTHVRHLVMPDVGFAWDLEPAASAVGPTLLPTPGAPSIRLAALPSQDAAAFAADTVGVFLARAFSASR